MVLVRLPYADASCASAEDGEGAGDSESSFEACLCEHGAYHGHWIRASVYSDFGDVDCIHEAEEYVLGIFGCAVGVLLFGDSVG